MLLHVPAVIILSRAHVTHGVSVEKVGFSDPCLTRFLTVRSGHETSFHEGIKNEEWLLNIPRRVTRGNVCVTSSLIVPCYSVFSCLSSRFGFSFFLALLTRNSFLIDLSIYVNI